MARKKKQHHEEHPDERWLITYADVLTLMFVLFMVLFSISVVNTGKYEQLKESLSKSFSGGSLDGGESVLNQGPTAAASPVIDTPAGTVDPQIPGPTGINLVSQGVSAEQALETSQLEEAQKAIDDAVKKAGFGKQVKTKIDERGLVIRLNTDPFLFQPGSADLNPQARRLLRPITRTVINLQNPVRVEGHTDSTPISTYRYPSNLELSGARASAVLKVLLAGGLPRERSGFNGFADFRPEGDNATAAGRQQNRRVEILVMRLQGAPGASPADALGG